MLALRSARLPLVNPAAYSYAAGSLWMTTSRYAAKNVMARRDPRAAFFVDGGSRAVLMRGTLEVFDPLSLSNQVRAALAGPGLYLGMAAYALRNVPFVTGYMLDIARLPREWMPYNRIVLQLHPGDIEVTDVEPFPPALAARVPAVPAEVSRQLAGVSRGYACWFEGGAPVIRPALWEVDRGTLRHRTGRRSVDRRAAGRARHVLARFFHFHLCPAAAPAAHGAIGDGQARSAGRGGDGRAAPAPSRRRAAGGRDAHPRSRRRARARLALRRRHHPIGSGCSGPAHQRRGG